MLAHEKDRLAEHLGREIEAVEREASDLTEHVLYLTTDNQKLEDIYDRVSEQNDKLIDLCQKSNEEFKEITEQNEKLIGLTERSNKLTVESYTIIEELKRENDQKDEEFLAEKRVSFRLRQKVRALENELAREKAPNEGPSPKKVGLLSISID